MNDTEPYAYPPVTPADVGRRIAALRTIGWVWRHVQDALVAAVQPCYTPPALMVQVAIGGRVIGWWRQEDVHLDRHDTR